MSYTSPDVMTTQDWAGPYGNPYGPAGYGVAPFSRVQTSEVVAASNAGVTGVSQQPAFAWLGVLILLVALRLIWEWAQ